MPDMQTESGITEELEPIIEYGSAILEICKDNLYNNENWNDRGLGWICENLIIVLYQEKRFQRCWLQENISTYAPNSWPRLSFQMTTGSLENAIIT